MKRKYMSSLLVIGLQMSLLVEGMEEVESKCASLSVQTRLKTAIEHLDIDGVQRAFQAGADPNSREGDGSPLVFKIVYADIEIEEKHKILGLFFKHPSLSPSLLRGLTEEMRRPNIELRHAIIKCNESEIEGALKKGADPNLKDSEGNPIVLSIVRANMAARDRSRIINLFLRNEKLKNDVYNTIVQQQFARRKREEISRELLLIAKENDLEKATELINQNADVNIRSLHGWTPLHIISIKGYIRMAEILLRAGADVNARTDNKWTSLHWACINGHEELVKLLIEHGARLNDRGSGDRTALHEAVEYGQATIVEILTATDGIELNARDASAWTPLTIAVHTRKAEIVEILLKAKARPEIQDKQGYTALHWAACLGEEKIITMLTNSCPSSLEICTREGKKPSDIALVEGFNDLADLLKAQEDSFADNTLRSTRMLSVSSTVTPTRRRTNSNMYASNQRSGPQSRSFPDVNSARSGLMRPGAMTGQSTAPVVRNTRFSCQQEEPPSSTKAVQLLTSTVINGVTVTILANNPQIRQTPKEEMGADRLLLECARNGNSEEIERALAKGAIIGTADWEGNNALHLATQKNYLAIVKLLISRGIFVAAQNKRRQTALHIACLSRPINLALLTELIHDKVGIDLQDDQGYTALRYAEEAGDGSARALLLNSSLTRPDALLLDQESEIEGSANERLLIAAQTGNCKGVETALADGAKKCTQDKEGNSAFHLAIIGGHLEVVRILAQHGFPLNIYNRTGKNPLHIACSAGPININMLRILVIKIVNIDAKDRNQCTALDYAIAAKDISAVRILIEQGKAAIEKSGKALQLLQAASVESNTHLFQYLRRKRIEQLSRQGAVNRGRSRTEGGPVVDVSREQVVSDPDIPKYPLHEAVRLGRIEAIGQLLRADSSIINIRNGHNETPLHKVIECVKMYYTNALLKKDQDVSKVSAKDWEEIPFKIVDMLLRAGAFDNAQDSNHKTLRVLLDENGYRSEKILQRLSGTEISEFRRS